MLELTTAQQDIYLEGKLFGKTLNNIGGYQKYQCELDVSRFVQARAMLFQENDAYRLRFHDIGGFCVPFVGDDSPPALRMVDFPTAASALAWIQEQFEVPFTDISAVVFEDALIRLSSDEYWYFAKAHHLIMDGWGFALQMQRFLGLYEQLVESDEQTPTAADSFIDYMHRQSDYRHSAQYVRSRDYWLARHEGAPGPLIACASGQVAATSSRRISGILNVGLMAALRKVVSETNTNLVAVMYSALYVYFSRSYQRNDITICSPVHNRRNAADKNTIGSFVNVNAHRLAAPADMTFEQLVEHVALVQRQDYRHSQFPLGDIVRAVREKSDALAEPSYEISFNYQKLDFQLAIHGRVVETHYLSHSHERLPLTFVLCEYGEDQDVWIHLDYGVNHFDEHGATNLLDRFLNLLHQVSDSSEHRISDYNLLTEAEWRHQFATWQGAVVPVRDGACLHDYVEEQVSRTPDRIAVTCGDTSLSYAQLNDRANRLAYQLIDKGADPVAWWEFATVVRSTCRSPCLRC
jgi:hypothetical protein